MHRLLPRALAVLVAAACGSLGLTATATAHVSGPRSGALAAQPPVLRVMPLGDSITVGVGSSTGAGYRLPLWNLVTQQSLYRVDLVGSQRSGSFAAPWHEGHSGWMIDDIHNQVDHWLADNTPDVVLLHIGINDLDRGPDKAHAADRMQALLDRIFTDEPDVSVIVQGLIPTTPGLQDATRSFNRQVRQLETAEWQQGRHLRYVDAPALTPAEFNDTLHPDDAGYTRMGQTFYTALSREVEERWYSSGPPPTVQAARH
ncbi:hypothetical protein GCM10009665_72770 [Kitasatospora nipponensis]|uniref:SGNH hydrolase-type esterase domain-containing protein n=1 Tax=Kitasatospora nipponensis TaxID=258049 RepID=A0ABN1WZV8_9ACTN